MIDRVVFAVTVQVQRLRIAQPRRRHSNRINLVEPSLRGVVEPIDRVIHPRRRRPVIAGEAAIAYRSARFRSQRGSIRQVDLLGCYIARGICYQPCPADPGDGTSFR